jgi:hypothetical protein
MLHHLPITFCAYDITSCGALSIMNFFPTFKSLAFNIIFYFKFYYLAISITLISLIKFTFTSQGYDSFSCIFSAIFFAILAASKSDIVSAFTKTLTSLPAERAYALSTQEKLETKASIS